VPPEAEIAAMYATPTVPLGREVVEMVSLLGSTGGVVERLAAEPQPARNAAAPKSKYEPKLLMPNLSHLPDPTLPELPRKAFPSFGFERFKLKGIAKERKGFLIDGTAESRRSIVT
jgi:hypothetical protein